MMMEGKTEETLIYANSLEHIQDELKRIDLLIHRMVEQMRGERGEGIPGGCMGLFISEEEINTVLREKIDGGARVFRKSGAGTTVEMLLKLNRRIAERINETLERGGYLTIPWLSHLFHLSPFETDCILFCLAPELDQRYEMLYAYLQNDVTRKRPTAGLIMNLLCLSLEEKINARQFFSERSPLFGQHLLSFSDESREGDNHLLSRALKLDDRIVDFLLGIGGIDRRIRRFTRIVGPCERTDEIIIPETVKLRMKNLLCRINGSGDARDNSGYHRFVCHLKGPPGNGQLQTADAICHEAGLILMEVDTGRLLVGEIPLQLSLELIFREALLQSSAVYFKGFDRLLEESEKDKTKEHVLVDAIVNFHGPVFLEGERSWRPGCSVLPFYSLDFPVPSFQFRKRLWESYLKACPVESGLDINALAGKFRFTVDQIRDALLTAMDISLAGHSNNTPVTTEDLYEGCRTVSNQKLGALSRKIEPRYTWQDLVLPAEKIAQMKDMCSYVKYRHLVYDEWGFDRKLSLGKGLNALFHGPSGTGKTMAAEIIAGELGLDLYKIDLSLVLSKFIGETEKNLSRIFKEAETSNAIIFFDEADTLFGKRTEVKDAHDRYANIEVGYLLQRMEEYEGIVILATNLMKNMDEAFVRRMHFQIEFPFPDEEHRLRIWKTVFPEEAPKDDDIDYQFLAKKFKITGGNIKNIALSAAFLAAENNDIIRMKHIVTSARREFQKMGKLCTQSDFGKYHDVTMEG